jgi:hypothetical protein
MPQDEPNKKSYTRSHEFVRSYQLDALCETLRFCIASQAPLSPACRHVLKMLRDDFVATGQGRVIEYIPDVPEDAELPDLLFVAEFLRATVVAFLSPEELDERGPFGLRPNRPGGAA